MKTVNEITEELNNMGSSLAGISRAMPYSVPAGYFNDLPGRTHRMAVQNEEALPVWGKAPSFSTPEGYFEGLTANIMNTIKAEHSPAFTTREMPYSVPAGYFETFPARALQAAKKATPVKKHATQIPLGRNSIRQIRWAAAAVLLICIGFGGYETFTIQPDTTEKMLSSVPNNDIQDYLHSTYTLDVPRIINNDDINTLGVDNKDIIQYLNETGWDMTE